MSGNWLNSKDEGGIGNSLLGDITGDGGLPDGIVNLHDLAELAGQQVE